MFDGKSNILFTPYKYPKTLKNRNPIDKKKKLGALK